MISLAVTNPLPADTESTKRTHHETSDVLYFAQEVHEYCTNEFKADLRQIPRKEIQAVADVCQRWSPHHLKTDMLLEAMEAIDPDSDVYKTMRKIVKERTSDDFIKDSMDGYSFAAECMPKVGMYSLSEKTTLTQLTYLCSAIASSYASIQKIIKKLDDFEEELKLYHNHDMWYFIKTLVKDIPDCRLRVNGKLKELFLPVKQAALEYIQGKTNKHRSRALLQAMTGFTDRHVPESMIETAETKDLVGFHELLEITLNEHKVWKQRRKIESFIVGSNVMTRAWTSHDASMKQEVRNLLNFMNDDMIEKLIRETKHR